MTAAPDQRLLQGTRAKAGRGQARFALALVLMAFASLVPARAAGDGNAPPEDARQREANGLAAGIPDVSPVSGLDKFLGRPVGRIEVVATPPSGAPLPSVRSVRVGEPLLPEVARRAARELLATGGFARVSVEVEDAGGGVVLLRLRVVPRRLVAGTLVEGGALDEDETLHEAGIETGGEVTDAMVPEWVASMKGYYARHGFPNPSIGISYRATDDPLKVVLLVQIAPGAPLTVARRSFVWDGVHDPPDLALDAEIESAQGTYAQGAGDRVDEEAFTASDHALEELLRARGFHRARILHQVVVQSSRAFLFVRVDTGPKLVTRYEGLHRFDADQIDAMLDLEHDTDRTVQRLASKVHDFYVKRGFLDAEVTAEERGGPKDRVHALYFVVREHDAVRVASRDFPCVVGGPLSKADVASEIDSFLEEDLPGGVVGPVDPGEVDRMFGPQGTTGTRAPPLALAPRRTYDADSYDRAQKHVSDYYRSQGFLSATVGPLTIVRRRCDPRSPPGACIPLPLPALPRSACLVDAQGIPVDEPPYDPAFTCVPDPGRGIACEPQIALSIPIKLGPQTILYDIAFEGNGFLLEKDLAKATELVLGEPASLAKLETARRHVLDAYKEEGFAFAEVRAQLDFSSDRTRARARFVVSQGERVVVNDIIVRGAHRTDPSLVLRRMAFERCPATQRIEDCVPYRPSDVRKSEERIASLGTFSSISISLEDPFVPAKRKNVVVEVQERLPQYLDIRPGFSTGEGFRITFEYGHRNVAGEAIQLTLRVQLGYLPDAFILDPDVKRNFDTLSVGERLERRNTISFNFPEIGLGPLIRLGLDGIDVRDNARDFGLTKEAGVATLTYRPVRQFYTQLGGSIELNNVHIFNGDSVNDYLLQQNNPDLTRLLRVPDGTTFAFAERLSATWDRRDNPFGATRGTLLLGAVEHVHAFPAKDNPNTITSDFLRFTGTISGYVRLSDSGMALAASLRGGRIVQLVNGSQTYPDRLFFLGGVDSMRGFLQDSMVPQDIAEKILAPDNQAKADGDPDKLTVSQVAIRGGDVFINPRLELRVPLYGVLEGALFLDAGNVWVEPANFNPFVLRYAAGPGLRIGTPIGPIAFDYGINLSRRVAWEDFGAFHFSIGLF